jgi:hypothetical protein
MTRLALAVAVLCPSLSSSLADHAFLVARARVSTPLAPPALSTQLVEEARSGCCSHHGSVAGCESRTRHALCNNGSDSPNCGCD